ncbi:phosphatidylglycerophosphatase A family protein [Halogeometricum borinquense]|uniref:phosphatidylglycerophosphatase A family protein n=1 Tax=Halogeometricum borinquense TaxID=60847 RepID=UPI001EF7BE49|nr:phosphatidylglycerophosphatase A [Halogeometricum borinquense]
MNRRESLLTVGGLGHAPVAPGTFGSLPPVAVALVFLTTSLPIWQLNVVLPTLALVLSVACVRFGHWAEGYWGCKDPRTVVADEAIGQTLPLLFLPWHRWGHGEMALWNVLLLFTAVTTFRLFDVTKLPPMRMLERLSGGWGILIDDLVAGVYATVFSHLLIRFVWPPVLG